MKEVADAETGLRLFCLFQCTHRISYILFDMLEYFPYLEYLLYSSCSNFNHNNNNIDATLVLDMIPNPLHN